MKLPLIAALIGLSMFALSCGAGNDKAPTTKLTTAEVSNLTVVQNKPADGFASIKALAEAVDKKSSDEKLSGGFSTHIGGHPEAKSWSLILKPDGATVYTVRLIQHHDQVWLDYGYMYQWRPPGTVEEGAEHSVLITTSLTLELKDGQWVPKNELSADEWIGPGKKHFHRPFTTDEAFNKYFLPVLHLIEDQVILESKK